MELRCLPGDTTTPTTTTGSPDPLYYCLPHSHRARERDVMVAVTGALAPCYSHSPGLAPAVPEVRALGEGGGRGGPGSWPGRSHCSWGGGGGGGGGGLGRLGWGAGSAPGINRAGGGGERGGGGGGGRERVRDAEEEEEEEEEEERGRGNQQSPTAAQSEQHESALSVYDNLHDNDAAATPDDYEAEEDLLEVAMDTDPLPHPLQLSRADEGGGGASCDSSSWSSCEIVLAGSSNGGPDVDQDVDQDQETDPDQDPESDSGPSSAFHVQAPTPRHPPLLLLRAALPQASPPALLRSQGPQGLQGPPPPPGDPPPPRVPPPLPRADPSASALRSLLTGLQQQIVRQRDEYETRIHSLEQHNEELQGEVVGLRANLAQQRRWYQAVQAKIVESERARSNADLRNAALQAEMEQFFDTFGELNNEAKKAERIVRSF